MKSIFPELKPEIENFLSTVNDINNLEIVDSITTILYKFTNGAKYPEDKDNLILLHGRLVITNDYQVAPICEIKNPNNLYIPLISWGSELLKLGIECYYKVNQGFCGFVVPFPGSKDTCNICKQKFTTLDFGIAKFEVQNCVKVFTHHNCEF